MDKKTENKLEQINLQSNWLKMLLFILSQISFALIYYNFNKGNECLKDFSIEMIAINLTVLSLNISTYLHVHKKMLNEIENIKILTKDSRELNLMLSISKKTLNLTLYQMYVSTIGVIISSLVIILFGMPILFNNILSVFAFSGTMMFLIQLLCSIKSMNKIRNYKSKYKT